MKTKILAVAVFTAISLSLVSCDWLSGKKDNTASSFSLNGKWTIQNVADSSRYRKNEIGIFLLAMSATDSIPITAEFRPDSILVFYEDTLYYYVDTAVQTIFVKDSDSSSFDLNIKSLTDSSLLLYAPADSLWYSFKRK